MGRAPTSSITPSPSPCSLDRVACGVGVTAARAAKQLSRKRSAGNGGVWEGLRGRRAAGDRVEDADGYAETRRHAPRHRLRFMQQEQP